MFKQALNQLKLILSPRVLNWIRPYFHGYKGLTYSFLYANPSSKLKIIAITGTKGKTTTTILTGRLLNLAGIKTGWLSTANICLDGQEEITNKHKMTTLDPKYLQKYLQKMVQNQCQYVVIEMSSQGLEQNRHWGLEAFEVAVFLNIYPEHIESHGGWDNYKRAKAKLFANLRVNGLMIGNGTKDMLENTDYMFSFQSKGRKVYIDFKDYFISKVSDSLFKQIHLQDQKIRTKFITDFDCYNWLFAWQVLSLISETEIADLDLEKYNYSVPGRMDFAVWKNQVL